MKKSFAEIFGKHLCVLRTERGITQKQSAQFLQVSESTYANWEQGRTEPNIEMLRKLGEIFKINIDELING